ncbi:MAG: AI-2E family transporter [Armatimonadota bacterium]
MNNQGLTFRDLRNAILFAALVFLVMVFIRDIVEVLLTFTIAALLIISLSPFVTWLQRHKIPRAIGTLIVILTLFGIIFGITYLVAPAIVAQVRELITDIPRLSAKFAAWSASLSNRFPFMHRLMPQGLTLSTISGYVRPFLGGIAQVTSTTIYLVASLVVILITTIYSLINPQPLVDGFLNAINPQYKDRMATAGQRLAIPVWAWAKGTVFAMVSIFALSWLALWLIGFKQALLFAIIAGVMELVPIVGPIVSAIPPILAALVTEPILVLYVVVAFTVIQQFENHILIPMVMSRQVRLHPVTVIFWVLVMGALFGLIGIFIATPTAVTAGVLYDELYLCEYRKKCNEIPTGKAEEQEENERIKAEAERKAREQMEKRAHTDEDKGESPPVA